MGNMNSFSYQRKGEHKSFRIERNKIIEFDKTINVKNVFLNIFNEYSAASKDLYDFYIKNKYTAKCTPILGDSRKLEGIKKNSIDLIITSPPYGDSHTTVAYGQFSRFPLEWLLLDYNKIAKIDKKLLGGQKRDISNLNSRILFDTAKKILSNEITFQNQLLNEYLVYLDQINQKLPDLINDIKLQFEDIQVQIKKVIDFRNEVNNIRNLDELMNFKNRYFLEVKSIRRKTLSIRKTLKSKENETNVKILKVYNERLPYVISFFHDFFQVFKRLYEVLDHNRKCCIVIGNRTVKQVRIPTDDIIIEMGAQIGFQHVTTFYREIPNKRMPKKNSPTNIPGQKNSTIERESIIILEKP
ncbi:MAG: hypothetical protein ACTSXP_15105 [Promethearchaeota archaeon]